MRDGMYNPDLALSALRDFCIGHHPDFIRDGLKHKKFNYKRFYPGEYLMLIQHYIINGNGEITDKGLHYLRKWYNENINNSQQGKQTAIENNNDFENDNK